MSKEVEIPGNSKTINNNNDVKVSNQFSLTINLGDSLNLLALLGGIYLFRKMAKRRKQKQSSL